MTYCLDDLLKKDLTDANIKQKDRLVMLAQLIDLSADHNHLIGIEKAIETGKHIEIEGVNCNQKTYLYYYLANAYSHLDRLKHQSSGQPWLWERETFREQIYYFRKAILHINNLDDVVLICSVYTNLGNIFSHIGRFVEADRQWNNALSKKADFSMAIASKGKGYHHLAELLFDPGHRNIYLIKAYHLYKEAINIGLPKHVEPIHKKSYHCLHEWFLSNTGEEPTLSFKSFPLGATEKEVNYRKWCLKNCLFLNPLNEIGVKSAFAHDILNLPPMDTKGLDFPIYHALFNELKMEYAYARYLMFESIKTENNFVNRELHLINTLDYPEYGIDIQNTKTCFRLCYSIFDKVAFFIKEYLQLNVNKEFDVSFRKIWYENIKNKQLRPEFMDRANWALRGLFWLSKDLYEDNFYNMITEPEAELVRDIRNHIEHKYLRVLWFVNENDMGIIESPQPRLDKAFFNISREELNRKTLRILNLAREAILYLVFAIHIEEYNNLDEKSQQITAELPLLEYTDF